MANRPISYPKWAPVTGPFSVQPPAELAATGWAPAVAPDAQHHNWLFGDIDAWIEYLDQLTNTGLPLSVIRLINGGTWSFNASTGALAWSADANLAIPSLSDASNDIPTGSVVLADGQVAYVVANLPTYSQGNTSTTSNPNQITGMNFTGNISNGMAVTGPGIPNGTTVLGVGPNFVTLSQNVTSNNTGATYVFAPTGPLTVQVANSTALQPTINTILLARRAGNFVYLGVNCAQMVLRDGEFKTLIGSGYFSIYQAPAGQNLAAGTLCYISPGSSDGGRTAGALYPLDVSAPNQAVRGTYAGVVVTAVNTGQTAVVLYSGFFAEVGLTAGAVYYADPSNPGGITATQPSGSGQKIEPVGFAVTSTILLFTGVAARFSGPTGFPIWKTEFPVDQGDHKTFALSQTPLNAQSVFVFVDGLVIPDSQWTLAGQNVILASPISPGQVVYAQYLLAGQGFLGAMQEIPTNPSGDRKTFVLVGIPNDQASTFVWVDGDLVPSNMWALTSGGGPSEIIFNGPLGVGQSVYVGYFTSISATAGAGVTGMQNIGTGDGVFAQIFNGTAQLKSIAAGANIQITETSDTITVAAVLPAWQQESVGTGDGSTVAFTLSLPPVAALSVMVHVDGLLREQGLDYMMGGAGGRTITFASAPTTGQRIYAVYQH